MNQPARSYRQQGDSACHHVDVLHSFVVSYHTCLLYLIILALNSKHDVGFRYVANETPGTKQAKLQLLEQLGWKCYSVTWTQRYTHI